MKKALLLVLVVVLLVAAFQFVNIDARDQSFDACDASQVAQTLLPYQQLLRAFDDTAAIAVRLPRDELIEPTMRLQEIRRELESLTPLPCTVALQERLLAYMNGTLDVMIAFIGGASSAQAQAGVEMLGPLRANLEGELAGLLGATLTPNPTSLPLAMIPVTGGSAQPAATPSATPVLVMAEVTNPDGANLRFGPDLSYTFRHVLLAGSVVEVIGVSEDGRWGLVVVPEVEEGGGWLFLPLLSIEGPLDSLPVVEE